MLVLLVLFVRDLAEPEVPAKVQRCAAGITSWAGTQKNGRGWFLRHAARAAGREKRARNTTQLRSET